MDKQCTPSFSWKSRENKLKKTAKKTKIENLQNGQEKYGGKKFAYVHIWEKFWKYRNFFKSLFEIALNGYLDKFPTWISLHLPKEALNALRKIQFTIGANFWNTLYILYKTDNRHFWNRQRTLEKCFM